MAFQFRRGTNTNRLTITPADGEPLFTTDTNKMFIGDGSTLGGIEIGGSGTHSHPASEVTSGTFGAGDYTFPANLYVRGSSFQIDSDGTTNTSSMLFGTGAGTLTYDTSAELFSFSDDIKLGSASTNQNEIIMTAEGTPAGRSVNAIRMNGTGNHSQGFFTTQDDDANANWFCGVATGSVDGFIINREDSAGHPDESTTADFIITDGGHVGIGIQNPTCSLDVVGRIKASTDIWEGGTTLSAKYADINHESDTDNPHSVDEGDILPDQASADGQFLTSDGSNSSWASLPSVVTDHGDLNGLGDNDHPQYRLTSGTVPASSITAGTFGAGDYTFPGFVSIQGAALNIDSDGNASAGTLLFNSGAGVLTYTVATDIFSFNADIELGGATTNQNEIVMTAEGTPTGRSVNAIRMNGTGDNSQGIFTTREDDATSNWFCGQGYNTNDVFVINRDSSGYPSEPGTTSYFSIDSSGRVGIGITLPTCSLDVVGRIKASTDIWEGGTTLSAKYAGIAHLSDTANPHSVDETDILPDQASANGRYLTSNGSSSSWATLPTGVTDHGDLNGLGDDDHTQYHNDARAVTWIEANADTLALDMGTF